MSSIFDWSITASDNATADGSINWAEGQAPSTVNGSARVMMQRVAELLKDLGGVAVAGGTANAITLATESPWGALEDGLIVTFRAVAANTDETTLNVNTTSAKPIVKMTASGEVVLEGGEIQGNGIYELVYSTALNGAAGAWLLINPSFAPIPVGAVIEYYGRTAPAGFLFPYGQAVSRTAFPALFAKIGTDHGAGDGSTTFNLMDRRGRAAFGRDDMGGTPANRLTDQTGGIDGATLGATGGSETHTLTEAEMPSHTHAKGTLATGASTVNVSAIGLNASNSNDGGSDPYVVTAAGNNYGYKTIGVNSVSGTSHSHPVTGSTASAGSDDAHNNLPPGIVCNFLVKT